jgi:catechol 2,3-dioxygenase-like lactoylglutathione lyase family enzyme
MKISKIKETCLYIDDLEVAFDFYHNILGLELISQVEDRHIFFRCGQSVLLCFIGEATKNEKNLPPHYAVGKQHIAFEVSQEDYEPYLKKLKERDIEITHIQQWKEGRESFYFEDPFGHVLEILPPGIWE